MATMFQPAVRQTMGTDQSTPHELVNQAVAYLHVICTGQKNSRLYFEKLPGASNEDKNLVSNIAQAISGVPGLRNRLECVKTISLES